MRILNLLFLFLAACGGGGAEGPRPEAVLLTPLPDAVTDAATISLRGTAERATSVTVDGVLATSKDGFATWNAVLDLHTGENEFVVEATDEDGTTTRTLHRVHRQFVVSDIEWFAINPRTKNIYTTRLDPGAVVEIRKGVAYASSDPFFASHDPWRVQRQRGAWSSHGGGTLFVYDPETVSLLGWSEELSRTTVVSSNTRGTGPAFTQPHDVASVAVDEAKGTVIMVRQADVLEIDQVTGDRVAHALPQNAARFSSYDPASRTLYTWHGGRPWPIWSTNLDTGATRRVVDSTNDIGETRIAVDPDNNRILIAVAEGGGIKAYDIDTGARSDIAPLDVDFPDALHYDDGALYVLESLYTKTSITRVDLATGENTVAFESGRGTGARFGWPEGMTFDPVRNKLVVSANKRGEGSAVLVDPVTGDREPELTSLEHFGAIAYEATEDGFVFGRSDGLFLQRRGTAPEEMIHGEVDEYGRAEGLVLAPAGGLGWYWDDGLVEVNTRTGDRKVIADSNLDDARALVFDATRNALFLRNDDASRPLMRFDRATGTLTEVPTAFEAVTALAQLPNGGNLLVSSGGELYEVAPDSGLAVLRSGPMMGDGITLGFPYAMLLDPRDPNRLFILSSDYQVQILMVDLRTGDRYLVSK